MDAVRVAGLRKSFDGNRALDGVDLAVGVGEIVAILGPNGAGKTTLMEVLEGHQSRDEGCVEVLGVDPQLGGSDWRNRIGIVLQQEGVLPGLTVEEALSLYAGYYERSRSIDELLAVMELADRRADRVDALSGGARRRLDLAIGLIGCPELIFLDEPTTGFDPEARRRAWSLIADIRSGGATILITTHYLEEAAALADRVVVLAKGVVTASARPDELAGDELPSLIRFRPPTRLRPPKAIGPSVLYEDGTVEMRSLDPARDLGALCAWAKRRHYDLRDISVTRPTLEDTYLELVSQ